MVEELPVLAVSHAFGLAHFLRAFPEPPLEKA
jgi:hypothetical protein